MIFTTTSEQKLEVYKIAAAIAASGLSAHFISGAVALASEYEGAYDLMKLWSAETIQEQDEICADLEELIDEHTERQAIVTRKPRIGLNQLGGIGKTVSDFKQRLRQTVDQKGGIGSLALKTGMCQSSLSRFFSSASMPRRTTLYRIARALDLPESEIVTEWIR